MPFLWGHGSFKYQPFLPFNNSSTSNFSLLYIPFSFCVSPLTMLPKFIIGPFKVEHQEGKHVNKRRKHERSFESTNMDVGLRLLPQITTSKRNVLLKSAMRKPNQSIPQDFCFLKTCNLCNKHLSPDKDIYMYRYI